MIVKVGIGAVAVCVLGGGAWWFAAHRTDIPSVPVQPAQTATSTTPPQLLAPYPAPAGMRTYANAAYKFALAYPQELTAKEYDEGDGAMTVVFQNSDPQHALGFQIFITPYTGEKISEERFKADEPSGVRTGVQKVSVAGVEGVSFYSTSPTLGDTAEVWFIRGGYLYEVTTLKPLAPWLETFFGTWQFL